MADVLLIERSEGIATVTLNRPEAMNALSRELRRAIVGGFSEIGRDAGVGAGGHGGAGVKRARPSRPIWRLGSFRRRRL